MEKKRWVRDIIHYTAVITGTVFMAAMTGCNLDPFFIAVKSITGVPDTGTAKVPLAITGTVNPVFASNSAIAWSLRDSGKTGAALNGNILNTQAKGIVLIRATVAHGAAAGKDYTQDFIIIISDGDAPPDNNKYTVIFDYDDGSSPFSENYSQGDMINKYTPVTNKPIPAGLYLDTPPESCTFDDWYYGDIPWNFENPVTGNMILTAHWKVDGLINNVPANDIAAAVNYINDNGTASDAYTLLLDENVMFSSSLALTSAAGLTVTGLNSVIIDGNFRVEGTAALTIGSNITFADVFVDSAATGAAAGAASLTVSSNAAIKILTLNANASSAAAVTITGDWIGRVLSLNLRGDSSSIDGVISYWKDKPVLKAATSYSLSFIDVAGFTLGSFITYSNTTTKPITDSDGDGAPQGYTISASTDSDTVIGTLIANNYAARIVSTGESFTTLKAAILAAPENGSVNNPTEIIILRDINSAIDIGYSYIGYTISEGKHIQLTVTVAAGKNWTIFTPDVSINDDFSLFTVSGGGSLTLDTVGGENLILNGIESTVSGGYHGVYVVQGGTFVMNSGKITGFVSENGGGGGVAVEGGTFIMSGGTISGNKAGDGGGVYVGGDYGTFTMSGGTISDNTAVISGNGGGVKIYGATFNMSGGTISGNTADNNGGGVYVQIGTFTMSGSGVISGNGAYNGGGVFMEGNTFTMSGGTIYGIDVGTDNSQENQAETGAAIYVASGTAKYGNGNIIVESPSGEDYTIKGIP